MTNTFVTGIQDSVKLFWTRMYSSRIRTARLLPISPSMHYSWVAVYLVLGAVPSPGGCIWSQGSVPGQWGMFLVPGGVPGPGGVSGLRQGGVPGPRVCTWSRRVYLVPRGLYLVPEGVPDPRWCAWFQEVYLVLWGEYLGRYPPLVDRITDMCKNITFANFVCGR